MATWTEERDGRTETVEDESPVGQIVGVVSDAADEEEVKACVEASAPRYLGLLERTSYSYEWMAADAWRVTVSYETVAATTSPNVTPSFDIATSTLHVDNSIKTAAAFGPKADSTRVNASNPINDNGETVAGADTLTSALTVTITKVFTAGFVTPEYHKILLALTTCVNSATFLEFPAGSVLFTGCSGSRKEDLTWEITFTFSIKPPVPSPYYIGDILVGYNGIAGPIGVAGSWDVVWAKYEAREVGTEMVQVPVAVYVEEVYRRADLNRLGIEQFV